MIRAVVVLVGAVTGAVVAVYVLAKYGERACDRAEATGFFV